MPGDDSGRSTIERSDRRTARERIQAETHRELLESGARAFSKYGYYGTSVAAVARDAGVGHGTFYLHFKDKQALFREIVRISVGELLLALREVRSRVDDCEESNRREIETIVAFAESHSDLLGTLATHGTKPQDALDPLCVQREGELKAEQKKGALAPGIDPVILARAEVGQVLSVIQWWLENDTQIPRQVLVDNLVAIRSLWIRTPPSKTSKPS